jgi:FtsZ-binding cell division protein ZapB
MLQLVKPSEYARIHGLSRQNVYEKIKNSTLPSRKIDGQHYVIVISDEKQDVDKLDGEEKIEYVSMIDEYREILKAKDETIEVLKASIEDLKEANAQITQTLQQEITLLKQAFHEMKTIYQTNYRLIYAEPNGNEEKTPHIDVEPEPEEVKSEKEKKSEKSSTEKRDKQKSEDECWIPLGDLIQRQQYNYNKAKQVVKRFKKAYKKGDKRIKKQNGIYFISCYDFYEDILE